MLKLNMIKNDIELIDADSIKQTIELLEKFLVKVTPKSKGGEATRGNKSFIRRGTETLLGYYRNNAVPITFIAYFEKYFPNDDWKNFTSEKKEEKRDQVRIRVEELKKKLIEVATKELFYKQLVLHDYPYAIIIKSYKHSNNVSRNEASQETNTEELSPHNNNDITENINNKNRWLLEIVYPDKINKDSLPVLSITIRTMIFLSIVAIVASFQNEIIFRYNLERAELARTTCFVDIFMPVIREQFDVVYDIGFKYIPILLIVISAMISCIFTGLLKLFCTGKTYKQIMKIFSFTLVILGVFTFYKLDLLFNMFNELLKRNNF